MFRELASKMKIIGANTRVRIFSVSNNDRYFYPYKLCNTAYINDRVRDTAYELIVDSRIKNESIGNQDVIDEAVEHNVDYCIPKDYEQQPHRTHESVKEFVDLYREHPECNARILIVLQPPYDEIYAEYEEFYSQFSHFALGGLQDFGTGSAQLEAIQKFRNLRPNAYVHGFGVGTNCTLIAGLREDPRLLDSLDIGTPELSVGNNRIPDATWEQKQFELPRGEEISTIRGNFAEAILYTLNYVLSPLPNEEYMNQFAEQRTIEDFIQDDGPKSDGATSPQPQVNT